MGNLIVTVNRFWRQRRIKVLRGHTRPHGQRTPMPFIGALAAALDLRRAGGRYQTDRHPRPAV